MVLDREERGSIAEQRSIVDSSLWKNPFSDHFTFLSRITFLCPAWKRWGTAKIVKHATVILHSKADEVVPFSDSMELVKNRGLPWDSLIVSRIDIFARN
jgi:hypothetical protein